MKTILLAVYRLFYEGLARRLMFRFSAQTAHHEMLRLLKVADSSSLLCSFLALIHRLTFDRYQIQVGGVTLPHPLILAAGLVKGEGFTTEAEALAAVESGKNIIPGWRSIPQWLGLVELGSFTRHPRLGNSSEVVWRDVSTRSTQNRVGLRNPGAMAAAAFMSRHQNQLPKTFGINIAASPGVTDAGQEVREVIEAFDAFLNRGIHPTWFTLNLSCPNTEDDPSCRQTESQTRELCQAVTDHFHSKGLDIPLWVKISPELSIQQYQTLMRVFDSTGVRAVIATNTLPRPVPTDTAQIAGVGGGSLTNAALEAVCYLTQEKANHSYTVDIIGCGGVMDKHSYQAFLKAGVKAVQYWSALIYRGPLAAAVIEREYQRGSSTDSSRARAARN